MAEFFDCFTLDNANSAYTADGLHLSINILTDKYNLNVFIPRRSISKTEFVKPHPR